MSSEKAFQGRVRMAMKGRWDAHKHNDIIPGVPDLSFSMIGLSGWVEFKWAPLPAHGDTSVSFTKGQGRSWAAQKIWMRHRIARGGACFVLAQIGPTMMLFWGNIAGAVFDASPFEALRFSASYTWEGKTDGAQLESQLRLCANHYQVI